MKPKANGVHQAEMANNTVYSVLIPPLPWEMNRWEMAFPVPVNHIIKFLSHVLLIKLHGPCLFPVPVFSSNYVVIN